jgi:hypothetical protein
MYLSGASDSAQSQICFRLVFLDGREWPAPLTPCRVFSPLLLTSIEKNRFYLFAWSWDVPEVREPEILCAGALCRLTSGDFPLYGVDFQGIFHPGEIGEIK